MQIRMPLHPIHDRHSPYCLVMPVCPRCHDTLTSISFRTPHALYCRCPCGQTWSVPRASDEPQSA